MNKAKNTNNMYIIDIFLVLFFSFLIYGFNIYTYGKFSLEISLSLTIALLLTFILVYIIGIGDKKNIGPKLSIKK